MQETDHHEQGEWIVAWEGEGEGEATWCQKGVVYSDRHLNA